MEYRTKSKFKKLGAVVVAQLVERSLTSLEIRSLNAIFGKVLSIKWYHIVCNFIYQLYRRKDENKEKEAGNGQS